MNNKLADFPLAGAGLDEAPDETVILGFGGWHFTVGDVRAASKMQSAPVSTPKCALTERLAQAEKQRDDLLVALQQVRESLAFYAEGHHFILADSDAWDTVSGEPQNYQCDEAGTATVEDGTVAKQALAVLDTPAAANAAGLPPSMSQFASKADYAAAISGEPVSGHMHEGSAGECFGACHTPAAADAGGQDENGLLSCAHCGGKGAYSSREEGYRAYLSVLCGSCGAESGEVRYRSYDNGIDDDTRAYVPPAERKADAAKLWNRRAHTPTATSAAAMSDAKDAARYRWARDEGCNFVWSEIGAGNFREGLDKEIDAAMQRSRAAKGAGHFKGD